jgi:HAD superfamily hydrolase (TIGR01509 family)
MVTAAIFDIDGTLMDSNDAHVESWDRAFREFGKQFSNEQLRAQIGKGSDKYLPEFLHGDELRTLGPKIDKYRSELYQTEYLPRVKPFPKVRELFERVKRDGKKIALASSGKGKELGVYKKEANIEDLVDCETTSDDADESKPAPDIFEASCKTLKLESADQAVVIGDTRFDIEAAQKVGLRTIALLCGGTSEKVLHEAGAAEIYRDPADLLAQYEQSLLAR